MNRVVHFEIHAADPERAAKFYLPHQSGIRPLEGAALKKELGSFGALL